MLTIRRSSRLPSSVPSGPPHARQKRATSGVSWPQAPQLGIPASWQRFGSTATDFGSRIPLGCLREETGEPASAGPLFANRGVGLRAAGIRAAVAARVAAAGADHAAAAAGALDRVLPAV